MPRSEQRANVSTHLNVAALLPMLARIARHGGVAIPELSEITGLSRPTVNRILTDARYHLGVIIEWRHDRSLPSMGEYYISDWGLLDKLRVLTQYASPRRD